MCGGAYYARLYRELHARHAFQGDTWRAHLGLLRECVADLETKTILDFGCGPKGGLSAELGSNVTPHDPFIERFAISPWGREYDVVFSSDVLEHMTLRQITSLLGNVVSANAEYVFLSISTREAKKRLPNGANAHLTVRPPSWWLDFVGKGLGSEYSSILAVADLLRRDVSICFRRNNDKALVNDTARPHRAGEALI